MVLYRFYETLRGMSGNQLLWWLVWCGLAALTIALLVMMRTNWGQSRPLHKCAALSLVAHLLFACFAATVQIVHSVNAPLEPAVTISSVDGLAEPEEDEPTHTAQQPWEALPAETRTPLAEAELERAARDEPQEMDRAHPDAEARLPGDLPLADLPDAAAEMPTPGEIASGEKLPTSNALQPAQTIETPAAKHRDEPNPVLPEQPGLDRANVVDELTAPAAIAASTSVPSELLDQQPALPRMSDTSVTSKLQSSLAGLIDDPSSASTPRPADAVAHDQQSEANSPDEPSGDTPNGDSPESLALDQPIEDEVRPVEGLASQGPDAEPGAGTTSDTARLVPVRRNGAASSVPEIYRQRLSPDRARVALQQGATPESEEAVASALRWLARAQSADGRWDPVTHEGGREPRVLGHDRLHAGVGADTGITGLALLAFLGAGHTHQSGDYPEQVRRGLDYLLRIQDSSGSLAGPARTYAAMYCHGMASLALSEAFAMTGDARLEPAVRRAVQFTVGSQNTTDGGWRYKPLDRGDTSQLGWQLMALRSAELAGVPLPEMTRERILRFLRQVTFGTHGGLASYRPQERASRTMTAEALVCRQFLGLQRNHPAVGEAADYLLEEPPTGERQANLYYWYYATLALHQAQGDAWQRWNAALQPTLISAQRTEGALAGSWDANTAWAGYGGRVYTTAMAALCLEVYYRYLPLYVENIARDPAAGSSAGPK